MLLKAQIFITGFIILLIIAIAVAAPYIAPFEYDDTNFSNTLSSPNNVNLMGTDQEGRDLLSRVIYGSRVSISVALGTALIALIVGTIYGAISGYIGGKVDSFLMRIADVQLSFSTLMVAIIILAIVKSSFGGETYSEWAIVILILVIGLSEWPQIARTVRSSTLAEKEKEYVDAAHVMGFGPIRIMFKHILPNCLSPIFVIATVQIANAIITEAALSFLGLGMPVTQPSLGSLISIGKEYLLSGSWWITLIPGLFLVLIVIAINLMGDFLRDVFNPRLYKE